MNREKERMLSGKLYQGNAEELVAERAEAKKKCFEINNISPEKSHEIMQKVRELLEKLEKILLLKLQLCVIMDIIFHWEKTVL